MADKLLTLGTLGIEELAPIAQSTGVSDAGKAIVLDTAGKLDTSLMPVGIGADVKVCAASENLVIGPVNLFDDAGTIKARKADASLGFTKRADGFVKESVTSGQNATVYFEGTLAGLTGLTVGAMYYLSATAGLVTPTIPVTAGHIFQELGRAVSTSEIAIELGEPIKRA